MGEAVARAVADGISHMIFGDLYLADIRAYREAKLAGTGLTPVFPLWQRPTLPLAHAMIASGLEAWLVSHLKIILAIVLSIIGVVMISLALPAIG